MSDKMYNKTQNIQNVSYEIKPEEQETVSLSDTQILKRYQENESWGKKLIRDSTEFCKNTKLYGFNYLAESKRFKAEKLYWFIFIFTSFAVCVHLLVKLWLQWNQIPTIIITQTSKPIWEVPFPAITICSEIKVPQRVYNFTDNYHRVLHQTSTSESNLTSEELQIFSDMSLLCDNHLYTVGNLTISSESSKNLIQISPKLEEVFFGCKWSSENEKCDKLFTPFVTEDGLCFTFNIMAKEVFKDITYTHFDKLENASVSNGLTLETSNSLKDTFPRRTTTSGTKGGLFVLLKSYQQDLDFVCRGPVQGYKVLLHQPNEVPRIGSHYFRAPLNQEVIVAIKPKLLTTAPDLKNYGSDERQCIFSDERQLTYFKSYNQENCRVECLANITLEKCGCVAFYMPRETSTNICGSGSNICMHQAEQELLQREAEASALQKCDCLPACTFTSYDAEISQADFKGSKVLDAFKTDPSEFPGIQMTRLTLYLKDMQFDHFQRTNSASGYIEFLAHCGGILTLFIGFSFLTIAEIVYFLSLRIVCNIKKMGEAGFTTFSRK